MTHLKKNWQTFLLILCLGCLLALAVIFHTFFMENILRPIALIFWLAWRVISSVNQAFYWAMVIILSAFFVIRMLPRESIPAHDVSVEPLTKVANPYLSWLSSFTSAATSLSALGDLQEKLKELSLSFISQTDQISVQSAEETIRAKQLPLSEESSSFLLSAELVPRNIVGKLRLRGALFLASLRKNKISKMPGIIDQPLDEILSFMEAKAETHHDHENIE